MPVSWQSRLPVRSATAMFSIIVPSTAFAVALVSRAASAAKPASRPGQELMRRMYSSFAASSTCLTSMRMAAVSAAPACARATWRCARAGNRAAQYRSAIEGFVVALDQLFPQPATADADEADASAFGAGELRHQEKS
jgi:hypothetical protein